MAQTHQLMRDRDDVRQNIIEEASKLFHKEGIRNVTMDTIAHKLVMSKRTLYQIFSDKEELLLACVMQHEEEERAKAEHYFSKNSNVLDFLLNLFITRLTELDNIEPQFFHDLELYPSVVAHIKEHKRSLEAASVEFLNRGKEQGMFRPEVNFNVVMRLLSDGLESMLSNLMACHYSQRELFCNTVVLIIRGCSTIKGIEMIDAFLQSTSASRTSGGTATADIS